MNWVAQIHWNQLFSIDSLSSCCHLVKTFRSPMFYKPNMTSEGEHFTHSERKPYTGFTRLILHFIWTVQLEQQHHSFSERLFLHLVAFKHSWWKEAGGGRGMGSKKCTFSQVHLLRKPSSAPRITWTPPTSLTRLQPQAHTARPWHHLLQEGSSACILLFHTHTKKTRHHQNGN